MSRIFVSNRSMAHPLRTGFLCVITFVAWTATATAKRPIAPKLFPSNTVALIRVTDVNHLKKGFHDTALGQMLGDASVQPTISQLWLRFKEAVADGEKKIGATAEEILAIPQGEIALGIVPVPLSDPAFVIIVDVGEDPVVMRDLLEQVERAMLGRGSDFERKAFGDTQISIFKTVKQDKTEQLVLFERDGTICISSHESAAEQVIRNWNQEKDAKPLSKASVYKSTMRNVRVGDHHQPQFYAYADVIGFARVATRGNFAANAGLAMLPMLGLDNLRSVGLSWTLVHDDFDSLIQGHVLLDKPRKGVLEMVAFQETNIEPEDWVPDDAISYTSVQWDVSRSLKALDDVLGLVKGKGTLDIWLENTVSQPLGIDIRKEFFEEITGRAIRIEWMEPPLRLNSQSSLIALELRDAERFLNSMDIVLNRIGNAFRPIEIGNLTAYRVRRPETENDDDDEPRRRRRRRRGLSRDATFMVIGDYFFFADRPGILRRVLETQDLRTSLSKSKSFDEATDIALGLRGGEKAALYTFFDAEWVYRHRYALLTDYENLNAIRERFDGNPFFEGVVQTLQDYPLPPFETLKRYVSQTGASIIADEENGLHYSSFLLKRKADRDKKK